MRTIFDGSLVSANPEHAVTLVDNHDTQPLQALEAAVEPWFRPLAYALILLREQGIPCVFYPDLYGARYTDDKNGSVQSVDMPPIECRPRLVEARKRFANGAQTEMFDDRNCVGFARHGTEHEPGCVVVLSNGEPGEKVFDCGPAQAGDVYVDFLGHRDERITIAKDGKASFSTNGGSVSVWVREQTL